MLTVITPAAHQRLTTLETLKRDLGITTTADDAFLADLIERASAFASTYCGRTFGAETMRQTCRLDRQTGDLHLDRFPVVTINSVLVDGAALDPSDYEVTKGSGLLHRVDTRGRFVCWTPGVVTVEYRAGHILPGDEGRTLPADVESAVLLLVRAWWNARTRDPLVKSIDTPDILSESYWVGSTPPEVTTVLDRYRVVGTP